MSNMRDEDVLSCPVCGEDYLHHFGVEIFRRDCEDSKTGTRIAVFGESAPIMDGDVSKCPSPRRDGIKIAFWCEICTSYSVMLIYQHKGRTFKEWEEKSE